MITITLEGNTRDEILREMSIIEASVRGSRIEPDYKKSVCPACGKPASAFDNEEHRWVGMDRKEYCCVDCSIAGPSASRTEAKPDKGIVAPDERSGQDGPEKPVCAYCGADLGTGAVKNPLGKLFCCVACLHRYDYTTQAGNILADACQKCQDDRYHTLMSILTRGYGLGPEEVAEILERVR